MRQQKVRILPGETLWDGLKREDIMISRPCGGKGTCGKCQIEVKGIGRVISCQFRVPGTYEVTLPEEETFSVVTFAEDGKLEVSQGLNGTGSELEQGAKDENVGEVAGGFPQQTVVIGVDLGTTTVAVQAITSQGSISNTFVNPQRSYGADVMTRIEASVNGFAKDLERLIKTKLNKMISEIVVEAGGGEDIRLVISGNTTMRHLIRGLSCEGLGKAPFLPVELGLCQENWKFPLEPEEDRECREFSLEPEEAKECRECSVTYLPGISAFVGGDIVSGIYGLGLMEKNEISLLLDLGTNGEMALIKEGKVFVASAAAGPAFEGTPLALRLHAAGIINLLYFMRKENIIDEYGTLSDEYFDEGYPIWKYEDKGSVTHITQDDIRAIQMAKGAIRAGNDLLLQEAQILPRQVAKIYLAGGMGFFLEPEKAIGIGLLPEGFAGRIQAVGNSSLLGALTYGKIMAMGTEEAKSTTNKILDQITENAQEIVLADHPDFEEKYIENMNFTGELNEDFINCD